MKKLFGIKRKNISSIPVVKSSEHGILQSHISHHALNVTDRLQSAGYSAYLVGGCVRDLLLGLTPKDFDVATEARPEHIKKLFRNCLLIGKRFRLAHIRFGREIIEVATYRANEKKKSRKSKDRHIGQHGMLLRDNVYGSIEEDAWRRDFTINALYYNPADNVVLDYCDGLEDIENKILRIIGEPEKRFTEDPVRLLRTIRFAGKLNFQIETNTAKYISPLAKLLEHVPPARLFDEILKLFHCGHANKIYDLLISYQLFDQLFPETAKFLSTDSKVSHLIKLTCENTDQRIQEDKPISPAFLLAAFLWYPMQQKAKNIMASEVPRIPALDQAIHEIFKQQSKKISIPKRFVMVTREIWSLQYRLEQCHPKSIWRIYHHPRFRAAYDFLLLRVKCNEIAATQAEWWTYFQTLEQAAQQQLIQELPQPKKRRRRKKTPAQND